jgi:hypothetical protein
MTWKVVTDKTQKVLSRSAIRSALDPDLRNLSLDPLKSTDFQMFDSPASNPQSSLNNHEPPEVVSFSNHGEKNKPVNNDHKFKFVISDENSKARLDENGEPMYISTRPTSRGSQRTEYACTTS